jgi:hypothetical protein
MRHGYWILATVLMLVVPSAVWALSCAYRSRPLLLEVESVIVDGSPQSFTQERSFEIHAPHEEEGTLWGTLYDPDSDDMTSRQMRVNP